MWTDVVDLRDFYLSRRGQVAERMIGARLRALWPDMKGAAILGLGFATPYLSLYRAEASRVLALMPAGQGILPWPEEGRNLTALSDEARLPLDDNSMDAVILAHAMESTEQMRGMLRETWRVMSSSGRLVVITPNRRGLWAQMDISPFGHGHPFTPGQLSRLLRDTMFTPLRWEGALFAPPFSSQVLPQSAPAWENIGLRWFKTFAGVILMEATKQIYAAAPEAKRARRLLSPAADGTGRD